MSKKSNKASVTGESESTDVAVIENGGGTSLATGAPAGFRIKRHITLPSLVLKVPGVVRVLRFDEPMHISKVEGKVLADGTREKPATVAKVTDLETGELFILLVPSVVQKNLGQEYPEDGYVGLSFAVCNRGKRNASQRYFDFDVAEVEAA